MRFEKNSKYNTIAVYVIICAVVIAAFTSACIYFSSVMEALSKLWEILKPIVYGGVMAFLFNPLLGFSAKAVDFVCDRFARLRAKKASSKQTGAAKKCEQKAGLLKRDKKPRKKSKNGRKNAAIALTYVIVVFIIAAFIAIIIPQVAASYEDLSENAPGYISAAERFLSANAERFNFALTPSSEGSDLYSTVKSLLSNSYKLLESVVPYVVSFVGGFVTELKNIFMGLIISVYLLASKKVLAARCRKVFYAVFSESSCKNIFRVAGIAYDTFSRSINGKLLDSAVIGALCFVGMTIIRLPYAPFISLLVGVTNMIPFLGPFIGGIPGALILFIVKPSYTLWFVILIVLLQQLDMNLIEPKIVGEQTGLPSLVIISSVLIMGGLFGVVGMFLAVPVFGVIYVLMREWVNDRLAEKERLKSVGAAPANGSDGSASDGADRE